MRTIIHVSDLHFGRIEARTAGHLLVSFKDIKPDLVIISGDITQRAWPREFKEASKFLEGIKEAGLKYFVIPGNHDVESFLKPISRGFDPYKNYKKYISETVESFYSDQEIAVASINTVRHLRIKNGHLREEEVRGVQKWFSGFPPEIAKIVVSHHPLDLPSDKHARKLARKSDIGLELLSFHNIDLYLSGHYHRSSVVTTEERYNKLKYCAIAVQAGTVSKRQRGELQSFNVIRVSKPDIILETYLFNPIDEIFAKSNIIEFKINQNLWKKM
jgi:DNA repair exonuclease SbcCD nuclease subunit